MEFIIALRWSENLAVRYKRDLQQRKKGYPSISPSL
jgi:hypothetical protein